VPSSHLNSDLSSFLSSTADHPNHSTIPPIYYHTARRSNMKSVFVLLLAAASVAWAAYWMEDIHRQGIAPFNPNKDYRIFRNVKQWGAKGDGGRSVDRP
jgi:hypothetical protein